MLAVAVMAATMFVLVPTMIWAFSHLLLDFSLPHLASNQRANRQVENPELSAAKCDSTGLRGSADQRGNEVAGGTNRFLVR